MKSRVFVIRPFHMVAIALVAGALISACSEDDESKVASTKDNSSMTPTVAGSGPAPFPSDGERIDLGDCTVLVWGSSTYGVVLIHGSIYDAASWSEQARQIADEGYLVLAVEDASVSGVESAMNYLRSTRNVEQIALIGASAGAGPLFEIGFTQPDQIDQIAVLAGSGDAAALGPFPKLFAASEGDGSAAVRSREMAKRAAGEHNEAYIVVGDAHAQAIFDENVGLELLDKIIERLNEFR